jgi:hypothetical protein
MERDFDKFFADAYAWILFQAQTESIEELGQLVGATPNASIHADGDVRHFRFNALTVMLIIMDARLWMNSRIICWS